MTTNPNLITQLLSPYIEQFAKQVAPKAHDAIDKIQHKWETRNDNAVKIDTENIPYKEKILPIVMGLSGGISGLGSLKNIPSYVKMTKHGANLLDRLLSRN